MKTLRSGAAAALLVLLVACGGQGGSQSQDSTDPQANAVLSIDELKSSASGGPSYGAVNKRVQWGARAHLSDVETVPGLTGAGVWIEVIDDFQTPNDSVVRFAAVSRSKVSTSTSNGMTKIDRLECAMTYQAEQPWTHGALVAEIAGGTKAAQSLALRLTWAKSGTDPACASGFYDEDSVAIPARLTVEALPGVAPQATVNRHHVPLGDSGSPTDQLATIQGHLRNAGNSRVMDVINLSLGASIDGANKTYAEVMATVDKFPIGQPINAVIAVAAGNEAKPCGLENLHGCNALAVALTAQDETRDSTLVVGALSGPPGAQTIADYSNRAGYLQDRFIWASGETGFYPDAGGNPAQGTSFAAPRVAGAAALIKQKYPRLTSAQIARLILDSADKDMNNDGVPDFSGVDPVFGHGKLSLTHALKLAAQRYP